MEVNVWVSMSFRLLCLCNRYDKPVKVDLQCSLYLSSGSIYACKVFSIATLLYTVIMFTKELQNL